MRNCERCHGIIWWIRDRWVHGDENAPLDHHAQPRPLPAIFRKTTG